MAIRGKKHRLPEDAYWGPKRVSFTVCIEGRRRPFKNPRIVETFLSTLAHWITAKNCYAPIYCFMPDHLHVMIAGRDQESRPKEALDEFKESTGHWFGDHMPEFSWQKGYHDHIIRISDDWHNHVVYILRNPVRAGLVEDSFQYPFLGSIGVELDEILRDL